MDVMEIKETKTNEDTNIVTHAWQELNPSYLLLLMWEGGGEGSGERA